jgi:hypothetical protein
MGGNAEWMTPKMAARSAQGATACMITSVAPTTRGTAVGLMVFGNAGKVTKTPIHLMRRGTARRTHPKDRWAPLGVVILPQGSSTLRHARRIVRTVASTPRTTLYAQTTSSWAGGATCEQRTSAGAPAHRVITAWLSGHLRGDAPQPMRTLLALGTIVVAVLWLASCGAASSRPDAGSELDRAERPDGGEPKADGSTRINCTLNSIGCPVERRYCCGFLGENFHCLADTENPTPGNYDWECHENPAADETVPGGDCFSPPVDFHPEECPSAHPHCCIHGVPGCTEPPCERIVCADHELVLWRCDQ